MHTTKTLRQMLPAMAVVPLHDLTATVTPFLTVYRLRVTQHGRSYTHTARTTQDVFSVLRHRFHLRPEYMDWQPLTPDT